MAVKASMGCLMEVKSPFPASRRDEMAKISLANVVRYYEVVYFAYVKVANTVYQKAAFFITSFRTTTGLRDNTYDHRSKKEMTIVEAY